jgi:hypothetical protein
MALRYNPFRPNAIATPGMFSGRWDEMLAVERSLFQTKHGNPKHFMFEGERGIGKSSLFFAIAMAGEGQLTMSGEKFNFLVISVDLSLASGSSNITSRLIQEFKSVVSRQNELSKITKQAWGFLSSWKAFGVEYKKDGKSEPADALMLDHLCEGMISFLKKAGEELDGILVLIDEADKASEQTNLGEFVKAFTERMTRLRCDRVCLGLSGLPTLTQKLRAGHESSTRIFESFVLQPIEQHEAEEVVVKGLAMANQGNRFRLTAP